MTLASTFELPGDLRSRRRLLGAAVGGLLVGLSGAPCAANVSTPATQVTGGPLRDFANVAAALMRMVATEAALQPLAGLRFDSHTLVLSPDPDSVLGGLDADEAARIFTAGGRQVYVYTARDEHASRVLVLHLVEASDVAGAAAALDVLRSALDPVPPVLEENPLAPGAERSYFLEGNGALEGVEQSSAVMVSGQQLGMIMARWAVQLPAAPGREVAIDMNTALRDLVESSAGATTSLAPCLVIPMQPRLSLGQSIIGGDLVGQATMAPTAIAAAQATTNAHQLVNEVFMTCEGPGSLRIQTFVNEMADVSAGEAYFPYMQGRLDELYRQQQAIVRSPGGDALTFTDWDAGVVHQIMLPLGAQRALRAVSAVGRIGRIIVQITAGSIRPAVDVMDLPPTAAPEWQAWREMVRQLMQPVPVAAREMAAGQRAGFPPPLAMFADPPAEAAPLPVDQA